MWFGAQYIRPALKIIIMTITHMSCSNCNILLMLWVDLFPILEGSASIILIRRN